MKASLELLKLREKVISSIKCEKKLSSIDYSLKNGYSGAFLFLRFMEFSEGKSDLESDDLAKKIFLDAKEAVFSSASNILDYSCGTLGLVTMLEALNRSKVLESDINVTFKELDFLLFKHIKTRERENVINEAVLGQLFYLYSRLVGKPSLILPEQIMRYESLVYITDNIKRNLITNNNNLDFLTLGKLLILLSKIYKHKIYPAIVRRLMGNINDRLERAISQIENKLHKYFIHYCLSLDSTKVGYIRNWFNEHSGTSDLIEMIEKNDLSQRIFYSQFFLRAAKFLHGKAFTSSDILEILNANDTNNIGLDGLAGAGLVALSSGDSRVMNWDQLIFLS